MSRIRLCNAANNEVLSSPLKSCWKMSVSGGTLTYSYQDAVTMGTDCSTKPLTGLELNLSVHIIYIEIPITWKRKKGKKPIPKRFL